MDKQTHTEKTKKMKHKTWNAINTNTGLCAKVLHKIPLVTLNWMYRECIKHNKCTLWDKSIKNVKNKNQFPKAHFILKSRDNVIKHNTTQHKTIVKYT